MFCVFTKVWLKIIQLLLNKTSSQFQLLPIFKVGQSYSVDVIFLSFWIMGFIVEL